MKVLVTGASKKSFLGNHVRKLFEKQRPEMTPIYVGSEYDLTKVANAMTMVKDFMPDTVVHMAAKCGGILANKNSPANFVVDNVRINTNVIDACHQHGVKHLVTLGSVCMYPMNCPVPFKEEDIYNGKSEPTNHPYGESKKLMLTTQNAYRDQHGMKSCMLLPVNMYGEWDHFDLVNSHVIPALIFKFLHPEICSTPVIDMGSSEVTMQVPVWGTGEATREFLYAGDCAKAILKAVQMKLDTPDPINIGTGLDISIKDLANLIAALTNYNGEIIFTGEVSDGQPKRRLDVSRAKEVLDFETSVSLREGLVKTIDWFKKTYEEEK